MTGFYLGALAISLVGMLLLDRAARLAFWRSPLRSAVILGLTVVFFLLWDLAGIGAGIFLRGDSPIATGIVLAPELPIEEPVFLVFLGYLAMNLLGLAELLVGRRRTRGAGDGS